MIFGLISRICLTMARQHLDRLVKEVVIIVVMVIMVARVIIVTKVISTWTGW